MTGPRITATSPASKTATRKDIMRLAAWIAFVAAYALVVAVLASPRGAMAGSSSGVQTAPATTITAQAAALRTDGNLPRTLALAGFAAGSANGHQH
jgi:phage-related tail protein